MKNKKQKKITKGWAVLVSENQTDTGGEFSAFGNGRQDQYPIFPDKKEALSWRDEDRNTRGRIIPVEIKIISPKK